MLLEYNDPIVVNKYENQNFAKKKSKKWPPWVFPKELSLKKLFGGSRYLVQSIDAKKLQVTIFSQLGLPIQDTALTNIGEGS